MKRLILVLLSLNCLYAADNGEPMSLTTIVTTRSATDIHNSWGPVHKAFGEASGLANEVGGKEMSLDKLARAVCTALSKEYNNLGANLGRDSLKEGQLTLYSILLSKRSKDVVDALIRAGIIKE